MSQIVTSQESKLLFGALGANGAFSSISGLVLAIGAGPIGEWIGVREPGWLIAIGVGLIGFGARLLWLARRKRVHRADAIAISAMDFGWVVGSVALVLAVPGLFSAPGVAAVLVVAFIVLTFFDLQVYALWKTRA